MFLASLFGWAGAFCVLSWDLAYESSRDGVNHAATPQASCCAGNQAVGGEKKRVDTERSFNKSIAFG